MVAEKWIRTKADRLAVEQGCSFDEEQAERVVAFAETYFCPQFVEGTFKPLPWQMEWLSQLYGWRVPDGRRRWRKALLTVSKKYGKSLLCAVVALYESLAAGVKSPLVISCSTTRQNATQIFDEVKPSVLRAHETWETAQNLPAQLMRYSLCLSGRQPKPRGHFLPNPWLLERLMCYEAGYTETAHSETPSSRSAPQKS
jgi:phage terminase large subunit-like protein